MQEVSKIVFILVCYRAVTILAGVILILLGYKLFCKGVYEKASEIKMVWGDRRVILKQVTPGVFFALLGVVLIGISVYKGIDVEKIKTTIYGQEPPWRELPSKKLLGFLELKMKATKAIEKSINGESLSKQEQKELSDWYSWYKELFEYESTHIAGAEGGDGEDDEYSLFRFRKKK